MAEGNGNGSLVQLSGKDFKSDQEVRWCPGCGDYAILNVIQGFMPELGLSRERIVFVSGIGCAARFPYYMQTYGMHSIHGRAPSIATGIATSREDLSVWVVTGDGDVVWANVLDDCDAGQTQTRYKSVKVTNVYKPMFPVHFLGYNSDDGGYKVVSVAGMRTE